MAICEKLVQVYKAVYCQSINIEYNYENITKSGPAQADSSDVDIFISCVLFRKRYLSKRNRNIAFKKASNGVDKSGVGV